MGQQFEDDFGGKIAEKLMHVDVRIPHEYSHNVTQLEREQSRIDWKDRCSTNMERMTKHEATPIYR